MSREGHDDCYSMGSDCSCQSSSGSCSMCEEEPDRPLPDGWHRAWDSAGHVYYWNEITRESKWTLKGIRLQAIDFEAEKTTNLRGDHAFGSGMSRVVPRRTSASPSRSEATALEHTAPRQAWDTSLAEDDRSCEDSQDSLPRTPQCPRSPAAFELSPGHAASTLAALPSDPRQQASVAREDKRMNNDLKQRLSSLVIQGLLPFHLGSHESRYSGEPPRIGNSAEFKKLARKLTHTVQEKELHKARQRGAQLEITDKVRVRVREYVRAYVKAHCAPLEGAPSVSSGGSPSSD
eukprot:scpid67154/ scgid31991/ 